MGERRIYTKEFKERAVELARTTDRKQSDIARELGIDVNMLSRWKREALAGESSPVKAFTGKGKARDEELAHLKRRVADLEETNEILKKAMAIFTVQKPR